MEEEDCPAGAVEYNVVLVAESTVGRPVGVRLRDRLRERLYVRELP